MEGGAAAGLAVSIAKEGLQNERCDKERTIVDREEVGLEPVEETDASGSKIQWDRRTRKKRPAEFKVSS